MKRSDFRDIGFTCLILSVGVAGLIGLQNQVEKDRDVIEATKSLLYIPDHRVLHLLALGDDALAADLLWVRSVFYIAANDLDEKQEAVYHDLRSKSYGSADTSHSGTLAEFDFRQNPAIQSLFFWNLNSTDLSQLYTLAETVTDLDPRFVTPYTHSALSLGLFAGRYDEAFKILEKGIKNCPQRWEPSYYRGFLKLFYLNDKVGAAADVTEAARKPNAPTIVIQLAAALTVGTGEVDQALSFLRSLRDVSPDDQLRGKIDDMLQVYGRKQQVKLQKSANDLGSQLDAILQQSNSGN